MSRRRYSFLLSFNCSCGIGLSFLLFLFVLSGCSDPLDEKNAEATNAKNMVFTTSIVKPFSTTRGTPLADPTKLTSMGVFGYHTGFSSWEEVGSNTAPNKMNHQKWTQDSPNVWSTNEPVSWGSGISIAEKFTFWAYAPYATASNGLTVNGPVNGKGFPTLTYAVPTNLLEQPDLMVATAKNIHPTKANVNLAYKHALTCIAFKAKGSGQKITSVKVVGVSGAGTLSVDPSGTINWSNLSVPSTINYTAGLNAPEITTGTSLVDILQADGYLMMIPQTLTADAKLLVTVDEQEYTFKLNTQSVTTWAPGQLITYNIDADKCKINVITDWRDKSLSNSYIINPSTEKDLVYKIPVRRVNEFFNAPGNIYLSNSTAYSIEANDYWNVKLGWSSLSTLTLGSPGNTGIYISKKSGRGPDDYFEITVPKGMATTNRGNFIVNFYSDSSTAGNFAWSFHFWVTDYNPYADASAVENASDDNLPWVWDLDSGNGSLFRLGASSGLYGSKRCMDRPLGYVEGQPALYYQFGRKDPFPSPGGTSRLLTNSYFGSGATININYTMRFDYGGKETYTGPSFITGIPTTFYNGGIYYKSYPAIVGYSYTYFIWYKTLNWTGQFISGDYVWNDPQALQGSGRKSIFDPSPSGFKLPEKELYSALTGTLTYSSSLGGYEYKRNSDTQTRGLLLKYRGCLSPSKNLNLHIQTYNATTRVWEYNNTNYEQYARVVNYESNKFYYWTSTPNKTGVDDSYQSTTGASTQGNSWSIKTSPLTTFLSPIERVYGCEVLCVEE